MLSFPTTRSDHAVPDARRAEILAAPGFGVHFTDHMAAATWTPDGGWRDDAVRALEPFVLHPAAAVLHYAQEIFEGLKAYRRDDGSIWLFRPEMNAARFQRSAARLCLPAMEADDFLRAVEELVRADAAWVPTVHTEESLYLRPYMVAVEPFLGVRPAHEIAFRVIASPAEAYFKKQAGDAPGVRLWISAQYTRAARGGTGAAKCGGNYAASLAAQVEAAEHGCDQVLYLDPDGSSLEESGTMNICLVTADGELITPGLGTILEGVTRDSVLALAAEHGLTPIERTVGLRELIDGARSGAITEVFACGTAAVITPIVHFASDTDSADIAGGQVGEKTMAMRQHLLDIQLGRAADPHGWCRQVC
ncbi:branched-chain amino acid aminotransferase [Cumulibacter manganitolerans]|uniref:branched-chain amino acid aminotransferase n=1 Tax=Cumulibacter manganitolerans TaxID=1884992 RepID=UPI0012967F45|nr:branched-chain amino acid aminotransferase [Cumulibacter manganitolerans]